MTCQVVDHEFMVRGKVFEGEGHAVVLDQFGICARGH